MRTSLPERKVLITKEEDVSKIWYDYFNKVYNKIIGYFDSSLTATIYKETTQKGNVNAAETAIDNFLIRKERLSQNEVIDIFVGGTFAANGNNKTIRIKLNSTAFYANTVVANGGSWQVRARVINLGDSQKIFVENGGTSTYTTDSINTTTTDIDVVLTLQGTASDDIVKEYFEVKYNV